jgi:lysozyme
MTDLPPFDELLQRVQLCLAHASRRGYFADAILFGRWIARDGKALMESVTSLQMRCTQLLEENRRLKGGAMKTSELGLRFIEDQEGFVDHVYLDVAGIPTIGYWHVVRHGDPSTVTKEQAQAILAHDVAAAESAINADVHAALTQGAFDALVSFTFNNGTGALASSSLLQILNTDGVGIGAAKEFPKWCHARVDGQLVVVAGLRERRIEEAAMFLGMNVGEARVALGLDHPAEPEAIALADAPPVLPDVGQPTPPEDLEGPGELPPRPPGA